MATPKLWLDAFQVNTGTAATGTQNQPQIVGLANGNILVAWEELSEGVGSSAGADIVGKIFDARGNVVRDSFQINSFRAVDNEGDFDIAANNLGGFVVAYVDEDISAPNHTTVVWEVFSSTGATRFGGVAADENVASDDLSNAQIALNLTSNDFTVTFTDLVSGNTDVRGVTVDLTTPEGSAFSQSSEFDAAQNSADIDDIGDVAILSNGNFVGVNREFDAGVPGVDVRIFQPDGTFIKSIQNFAPGINTLPRVTGLANGNFVVIWNQSDSNNGDIFGRIYDATGTLVKSTFTVTGTSASENEPDVAALPDGRFVVFWDDESFGARAQVFNANGTTNGNTFDLAVGSAADCDVSVTADGRILFAWQQDGEMYASIWDPRGNVINVSDFQAGAPNFLQTTDVIARKQGGTINGDANDNFLTGLGGVDELFGFGGEDTLLGGGKNDLLFGGGGNDILNGQAGNDTLCGGTGADTARGGAGKDVLKGEKGNDNLLGQGGADKLLGGDGEDHLSGGKKNDFLNGGGKKDKLEGGSGNDKLLGGGANDRLLGDKGRDELRGDAGDDKLFGGAGVDTAIFKGNIGRYNIIDNGSVVLVVDTLGQFGTDRLKEVEKLKFGGQTYTLAQALAQASASTNASDDEAFALPPADHDLLI